MATKYWYTVIMLGLCCAVVALGAPAAQAEPDAPDTPAWTSYPFYGGNMTAIIMDPSNAQVSYVGTEHAGVYKTTNGGQAWFPARGGLSTDTIECLAIDPRQPNTLYAGTTDDGVWKSANGGASWSKFSRGLTTDLSVYVLVIDPQTSGIVYAGMGGRAGNIYKTTDGGANWRASDAGIPRSSSYANHSVEILALAIDPQQPTTLYAGTYDAGVFKTVNGSQQWTPLNDGVPTSGGRLAQINALAIDPFHANRPVAIIDSQFYRLGADNRWTRISQPGSNLGYDERAHLYLHPTNASIVYTASAKSTDAGVSWHSMSVGMFVPHSDIAFHPTAPDHILVATEMKYEHRGGVYKSENQGTNWYDVSHGITAQIVQGVAIDPQNANNLYAGLSQWMESGIWRSTDRGLSWDFTFLGRDLFDIAVDPLDAQKVYVAGGNLHLSTDQGASFQEYNDVSATCIGMTPGQSNPVYTCAYRGVNKTTDGGLTWQLKNSGLPVTSGGYPPTVMSLTVDPNNASILWAGTQYVGLARSTDSGETWQARGFAGVLDVDAVAVKPGSSQVVFVGTGDLGYPDRVGRIYKSTDGGQTWQIKHSGVATVTDIKFDPRNPQWMYAATGYLPNISPIGTGQGILRSIDGGEHWSSLSSGIFYPVLYSLAISQEATPLLLAASFGSGLYGLTPPGVSTVYLPDVRRHR